MTTLNGNLDEICPTPQCAISHMARSLYGCMVSIQGQSFHADHVTEEMLINELETSGELNLDYHDGLHIRIQKFTRPQQQTS